MPKQAVSGYLLGHSPEELQRLETQAAYFAELTEAVLRQAGISQGMRVLDIGSGAGDVSMLASRIVGATGSVVGVDVAADAVELATARAAHVGLDNVRFELQDVNAIHVDVPFDALIGRLVLMYFPDPAVALRHLTSQVRPGGIVAFHEIDIGGALSSPACELFETSIDRIRETTIRAGIDARIGLRLGQIFTDAGLPLPVMRLAAYVEHGSASPLCEQVAAITRTLLPVMQQTGVATAAEVDVDTLANRLGDEIARLRATVVSPSFIGAWTKKPHPPA